MAEPYDKAVLRFPLGTTNVLPEHAVPEGAARRINNFDITDAGCLAARAGLRLVKSGSWLCPIAHPSGKFMLAVKDGVLVKLTSDGVVYSITAVAGQVVYAVMDQIIYWSDGVSSGCVLSDGTATLWGLVIPPQAVCEATATGGLSAGDYQVTLTAIHPTGIESGAPDPVSVTVPEGGGIRVYAPAATGVLFGVYISPPFGESIELRWAGELAPSASAVFGPLDLRGRLDSLGARRPPAGSALAAYKGRIWIASGPTVWVTSEQSPHRIYPSKGNFRFESDVTMLGTVEDGVYVGLSDRVYFLQGKDVNQMVRRVVDTKGAITGGGKSVDVGSFLAEGQPPFAQCAWVDSDGILCIGKPSGQIVRPASQFVAGYGDFSSSCDRDIGGIRQLVLLIGGDNPITSPLIAEDVAVSATFTHGVTI